VALHTVIMWKEMTHILTTVLCIIVLINVYRLRRYSHCFSVITDYNVVIEVLFFVFWLFTVVVKYSQEYTVTCV